MIRKNAFFITGTLGMIITATLHIFLSLGLGLDAVHTAFFSLYPVFVSFLAIGFGQIMANTRQETARIRLK